MLFRPEVAPPMSEIAEILMRGPSTLTLAERELIVTYVSAQNDCRYCQTIQPEVQDRIDLCRRKAEIKSGFWFSSCCGGVRKKRWRRAYARTGIAA
jgi:hypothetical protein